MPADGKVGDSPEHGSGSAEHQASEAVSVSQNSIRPRRFRASDAIVVAAVPVVAYALAYAYETGYAERLGVPVAWVRVQPENVAWALMILCAISVPLFMLVNVVVPLLPPRGSPRRLLILTCAPLVLYIAVGIFLYSDSIVAWAPGAAFWVVQGLAYYLPPALRRAPGTRYWDRFSLNLDEVRARPDLVDRSIERFGPSWGLFVPIAVATLLWVSFGIGRLRASVQPERILVDGFPSTTAVIRSYGGTWLCGEVDATTWAFTGRFRLLDMAAIAGHALVVSYGRPIKPFKHIASRASVPVPCDTSVGRTVTTSPDTCHGNSRESGR